MVSKVQDEATRSETSGQVFAVVHIGMGKILELCSLRKKSELQQQKIYIYSPSSETSGQVFAVVRIGMGKILVLFSLHKKSELYRKNTYSPKRQSAYTECKVHVNSTSNLQVDAYSPSSRSGSFGLVGGFGLIVWFGLVGLVYWVGWFSLFWLLVG